VAEAKLGAEEVTLELMARNGSDTSRRNLAAEVAA
jgi:hypothetical protein